MGIALSRVMLGGNMKVLIFILVSGMVSIASANDLAQALGAALKEAEKNHTETQVVLEVDADRIEQAKFRRHQDPRVLNIRTVADIDDVSNIASQTESPAPLVDADDTKAILQEVNDN